MTLMLSSGTLIAVSACFVATRFVPAEYLRTDFLPLVFLAMLVVALVHSYALDKARRAMQQQLLCAAVLFALCPLFDLAMLFNSNIQTSALIDVWLVNMSLGMTAFFCMILYRNKTKKAEPLTESKPAQEPAQVAAMK